jgi:hypothetical protein
MTEHRAKTLSTLLPIALSTGYSDIEHDFEPLKVLLFNNPSRRKLIYQHLEL